VKFSIAKFHEQWFMSYSTRVDKPANFMGKILQTFFSNTQDKAECPGHDKGARNFKKNQQFSQIRRTYCNHLTWAPSATSLNQFYPL